MVKKLLLYSNKYQYKTVNFFHKKMNSNNIPIDLVFFQNAQTIFATIRILYFYHDNKTRYAYIWIAIFPQFGRVWLSPVAIKHNLLSSFDIIAHECIDTSEIGHKTQT